MISAITDDRVYFLVGNSSDTKPTEWNNGDIQNGSVFRELDTSDVYLFDGSTKTWKKSSLQLKDVIK